jgi:Na+/H+ antiporter NhaD/arsenite permease-like protein
MREWTANQYATLADVGYSPGTGVDWNVVFLLLGMMIIVGVLRQTGVFEFLAIWAAKWARGQPLRIMITSPPSVQAPTSSYWA